MINKFLLVVILLFIAKAQFSIEEKAQGINCYQIINNAGYKLDSLSSKTFSH